MLKHLAEKREHGKEVVQKAIEGNCNFSKMVEEKLHHQMETYEENRSARMAAHNEKFKEKVTEAPDVVPTYMLNVGEKNNNDHFVF